MQDITEKILAHIREKVKETLEEMIKEERRAYLEENLETKANGYYLRSLNTPIGKLEGLRVARGTLIASCFHIGKATCQGLIS